MTAKKYKVTIFGDSYGLVTDEPEEHVMQTASMVDAHMTEIANRLESVDSKKLAVLAALQIASKLRQAEQAINQGHERNLHLADAIDSALEDIG